MTQHTDAQGDIHKKSVSHSDVHNIDEKTVSPAQGEETLEHMITVVTTMYNDAQEIEDFDEQLAAENDAMKYAQEWYEAELSTQREQARQEGRDEVLDEVEVKLESLQIETDCSECVNIEKEMAEFINAKRKKGN